MPSPQINLQPIASSKSTRASHQAEGCNRVPAWMRIPTPRK